MTTEELLATALRDVQHENARHVNRLRAVGVGAFTATIGINAAAPGAIWGTVLIPTSIYFALALALMIACELNQHLLRASRFSVPILDMPMVFITQWVHITVSENPGHVSEFTVALFVCLLLLAGFTLSPSRVYLSFLLAVTLEQILQHQAGMDLESRVSSVIAFAFTAWICIFASRNRIRLVETITRGEARRQRLQRYFSPGVGEILEEQETEELAQGQDCELTVLFTDIRGFTAMSESLTTREIIKLLNSYHALMVEIIFRHGGTLDKYLGDGLMAYFNAPVGQPDHASRAVKCALEMQHQLEVLNSERATGGQPPFKIVIGIHTGRAIVGDIGAPHRREFTAIGDAVNVASRLEGITKELDVGILASEATVERVPGEVRWLEQGEFAIRGCSRPMRLFSPVPEE